MYVVVNKDFSKFLMPNVPKVSFFRNKEHHHNANLSGASLVAFTNEALQYRSQLCFVASSGSAA